MTDIANPLSPVLQALGQLPEIDLGKKQPDSGQTSYCVQGQLPLNALRVEVGICGELAQPISPSQAAALHATSQPAPYGHREATLLDTRVRDTGRIASHHVQLHWDAAVLQALQAQVAQALGLAALELRLHDLLVYGPGQFFKPHQDTEKHPGMVGTLVLVWPSAHIGGTLAVQHAASSTRFASQHLQAQALRWCAFYADCQHEVLPLEEGWRVVLTFDLVVPEAVSMPSAQPQPALVQALRQQMFAQNRPSTKPWVFLLEHEYSEHGLRWALLKGADRSHVQALVAAASELGLIVHLALAEIHENWSAIEPESRGRRYRNRDYHEDHDQDGNSHGAEPDELLGEDMCLDFWIDANDQVVPGYHLMLPPQAAESFVDTGEDYLVGEEYEGYMGNYGQTLDYWYRRAALVVQTREAQQASRFEMDFDTALQDALALGRSGQAAVLAQRLQDSWGQLSARAQGVQGARYFADYAELAWTVDNAETALALCRNFQWAGLSAQDGAALVPLVQQYGTSWGQALLQAWIAEPSAQYNPAWHAIRWFDQSPWPQDLHAFAAACPPALRPQLLQCCQALWLACNGEQVSLRAEPRARSHMQAELWQWASQLANAMQLLDEPAQTQALQQWVASIEQHPTLYPVLELPQLLQKMHASVVWQPALQGLRAALARALAQTLAAAERAPNDYRVEGVQWTCRCATCSSVIAWAQGSGAQPLELPMVEQLRQHVERELERAAAPLRCETRRQGRPYQLIIHKPADLHTRDQAQRAQWAQALAWLQAGGAHRDFP
ncbi:hypothetical protein MASR1M59_18660 [Melaminivora sp.]